MPYRLTNVPDTEIVWCIQLYRSRPAGCLAHLRKNYPASRVVLLVDGDQENLSEYQTLAKTFSTQLIAGEHLMALASCHSYVERLLLAGVQGTERYILRIDPDTRIWRRFLWLPDMACAFGTLETTTQAFQDRIRHPPNIQGGCIGMTRDAAEGVIGSGILSGENCVTNALQGWARTRDCEEIVAKGMMLDDFILSWAIDAAGFPIIQHPEIASYWRGAVDNTAARYAVTHPHKELEV